MPDSSRFKIKFGPLEESFRQDPKKPGHVQFVRRRAKPETPGQHHDGTSRRQTEMNCP
jgi:hypothetical protein